MKLDIFFHYVFYKLFKLLQERTGPAFTWAATISAITALELWVMISVVGGVAYVFGWELFAEDTLWTFFGMFAVILVGLNVLIFGRDKVVRQHREMFDGWEIEEHQKYVGVLFGLGVLFVLQAIVWN